MIRRAALLAALAASSAVQALEIPLPDYLSTPGEWVLRGPARSWHDGNDYAPPVSQWGGYTKCGRGLMGGNSWDCIPQFTKQSVETKFNEKNSSIGIEKQIRTSPGIIDKIYINAVEDSFSKLGVMAGIGRDFEIAYFSGFRIGAGITGGLWNRTINNGYQRGSEISLCDQNGGNCTGWGVYNVNPILERKTIFFILPFLSIEHKDSGIGAEIAIAPKIDVRYMGHVPETTVIIQTTFNLSKIFKEVKNDE